MTVQKERVRWFNQVKGRRDMKEKKRKEKKKEKRIEIRKMKKVQSLLSIAVDPNDKLPI